VRSAGEGVEVSGELRVESGGRRERRERVEWSERVEGVERSENFEKSTRSKEIRHFKASYCQTNAIQKEIRPF